MTILVTGGAGFIGSNFVLDWQAQSDEAVITLDAMTYAGHPDNLVSLDNDPRHRLIVGDICNRALVDGVLAEYRPRAIVHLAAESHVDRSIDGPASFIQTNLVGTFTLLEAARNFIAALDQSEATAFRFLHVSTDEVYGSLGYDEPGFTERSRYAPNSPYSASKAGADHLVRAYHHTYGLPVLTTNCTNNYGPRQFPEKLIPVVIERALAFEPVPIYGTGKNIRDWIYVSDHCHALRTILRDGTPGETYNVSAGCERTNLELAVAICDLVDELSPGGGREPRRELLSYVPDRPGHDLRYAMSAHKLRITLGWKPQHSFYESLRSTVAWYLQNRDWVAVAKAKVPD